MVFNSAVFLVFFIIFIQLYWLINNKFHFKYRNIFTIVASYVFYGWWDWRFLSLIVVSSAIDYTLGLKIYKTESIKRRKALVTLSLISNLGILGFFKYFNFFIDSFNGVLSLFSLSVNVSTLSIILPVGISFYTFQTLSYTIDISRGKLKPTNDIISFFAFVSFFPQLVAGPIERASNLLKQFSEKKTFSYANNVEGLRLILWGLFKKVVIADNFGVMVEPIFNTETGINGLTTLLGGALFAFQVYADFSGYSDIAIGISRMLGFKLLKNFATPYFSKSFEEFWRRWHISLSTWFRDYVYIPLGGNKGSTFKVDFNLFLTFTLSGLWHGAGINFVLWGALHGLVIVIEKHLVKNINKFIYWPIFFTGFVILLVVFRGHNFWHIVDLMKAVFNPFSYSLSSMLEVFVDFSVQKSVVLLGVFTAFMFVEYKIKFDDFSEWIGKKARWVRYSYYYILVLIIMFVGNFTVKPSFIYFQF